VSEKINPQDEPLFRSPAVREVHWALELAASPKVSPAEAAQIWQRVKQEATADAGADLSGAIRRLRAGLLRGWREVTATLVQEALIPSPAVRGTASAQPALLVYETDAFAISLSFSAPPETNRLRMVGQLVPKTATEIPAGGKVVVWSERETASSEVNEHGEFALDDIPRGDLHMDILLGEDAIQLSPIQTRSSRDREE
jgi:hypothetical protein